MRKIAASYVFPVSAPPIKYGILYLDEDNTIVAIKDNGGVMVEESGCEYYNGILVPGFVNAHTHLELSHLKGLIEPGLGMKNFLRNMISRPAIEISEILKQAEIQDRFMYGNGIVAVGDISNTADTVQAKAKSNIQYHTFVELMGLTEQDAEPRFEKGTEIVERFRRLGLQVTLTPHAPYSISDTLMSKMSQLADNHLLSVHTLENSIDEETLTNNPNSFKWLFNNVGISDFDNRSEHPYQFILKQLKEKQLLLVHNVHARAQDWEIALNYAEKNDLALFAVTCPRSNVFINKELPNYSHWPSEIPICIGTDSLVSNTDLSVYNEMLFLLEKTNIPFPELLTWATLNGAKALQLESVYGSFDVGKKPGVNLISHFDYKTRKPAAGSTVSRLV